MTRVLKQAWHITKQVPNKQTKRKGKSRQRKRKSTQYLLKFRCPQTGTPGPPRHSNLNQTKSNTSISEGAISVCFYNYKAEAVLLEIYTDGISENKIT